MFLAVLCVPLLCLPESTFEEQYLLSTPTTVYPIHWIIVVSNLKCYTSTRNTPSHQSRGRMHDFGWVFLSFGDGRKQGSCECHVKLFSLAEPPSPLHRSFLLCILHESFARRRTTRTSTYSTRPLQPAIACDTMIIIITLLSPLFSSFFSPSLFEGTYQTNLIVLWSKGAVVKNCKMIKPTRSKSVQSHAPVT